MEFSSKIGKIPILVSFHEHKALCLVVHYTDFSEDVKVQVFILKELFCTPLFRRMHRLMQRWFKGGSPWSLIFNG